MSRAESRVFLGYNGILYADSIEKRIKRLKELDRLRKQYLDELDAQIAELKKIIDLQPKKV